MSDAAVPATEAKPASPASGLAWTSCVIATTCLLLALFNAASIRSWADGLAPTPANLAIQRAADGWADFTGVVGLAAPRAGLHSAWEAARGLRFPETTPQNPQR